MNEHGDVARRQDIEGLKLELERFEERLSDRFEDRLEARLERALRRQLRGFIGFQFALTGAVIAAARLL